ncbi:hypothetical protein [Hydrogenophaga pseudoflava]|jgi:uncharacterized membrane protein YfcA|uniref:hypothetical protein n=1 Tax=Hydrogenophaga pseudoflava TaxID=47421 RepID=UPI000824F660|nr:hypothetical protein [Hydrogenophaga pseudoflava]
MRLLRSPKNSPVSPVAEARRDTGWLARTKVAVQGRVLLVVEAAGALASVVGVPLAALTGKLYLAALVALFGLGCCLRFVRLRQRLRQTRQEAVAVPPSAPVWLTPVVGLLSAVEVAVLVEATRLPVRADQTGFDTAHWWWVLAGFVVLFWLQRGWLGERLTSRTATHG